jgi:3-deoxy-7-phosphoheptulonate synthase
VALIRRLDPAHTPGKVTLITRFGADKVEQLLPPIIRAVQDAALPVVWICDAVHGNTFKSSNGYKTRPFDAVIRELQLCFEAHTSCASRLGGVHLELTGDNVTECVGGPQDLAEDDLPLRCECCTTTAADDVSPLSATLCLPHHHS